MQKYFTLHQRKQPVSFEPELSQANVFNKGWSKFLSYCKGLTLSQTSPGFYVSAVKFFENTVAKGEIARYEQFLLFPLFFLLILKNFLPFSSNLKLSSANYFSWKSLKFVVWERVILYFLVLTLKQALSF